MFFLAHECSWLRCFESLRWHTNKFQIIVPQVLIQVKVDVSRADKDLSGACVGIGAGQCANVVPIDSYRM